MELTKKELIIAWAKEFVPKFNELALKIQTNFYTQSPLNIIDNDVETIILGINPKGATKSETKEKTPQEFLKGNPEWEKRFDDKAWHKFVMGARKFLG